MHLHLDPVGGVAGDMFAAAILDAFPGLEGGLRAALAEAGLTALVAVERARRRDQTLQGSRISVSPLTPEAHHHRSWRTIRHWLDEARLEPAVRDRALSIFSLLAEAEGEVHGVLADEVEFHEVGAWDSIADIVIAAWLIESLGASWSCEPLPLGSGRITGAHGILPVPAPATARLLMGFPVHRDGIEGERVTPTGAAILRHLAPSFSPNRLAWKLSGTGTGFGHKSLPGIANALRIMVFEANDVRIEGGSVAVCVFEVDDQTPEDLAVALGRLRALPDIFDAMQIAGLGKKARMAVQVQILARPEGLNMVLDAIFRETSTLGVRWRLERRAVLRRDHAETRLDGRVMRVKHAERPDGRTTKAEMDDLALLNGGRREREAMRRRLESQSDG